MPTPLYRDVLTQESEARLEELVRNMPQPVMLAGGHAVREVVQQRWKDRFNEEYFGSRDIDICYHVDPSWENHEFVNSAAGQAPRRIKEIGFHPMGAFHFGIWLDNDGQAFAKEPPAPAMLGVDYHVLRLDPMVTHVHPLSKDVLGFNPIDEPLLAPGFKHTEFASPAKRLGPGVLVPRAPLLIATKLSSLPGRNKQDKAIKDLCDLYALVAFGGSDTDEIKTVLKEVQPDHKDRLKAALKHPALPQALDHLDLAPADYQAAMAPMLLG